MARIPQSQEVITLRKETGDIKLKERPDSLQVSDMRLVFPRELPESHKPIWDRIVEDLDIRCMSSATFTDTLAIYVNAVFEFYMALQMMKITGNRESHGYTCIQMIDGKQTIVINPWVAIKDNAAKRIENLEKKFGFSPQSVQLIRKTEIVNPVDSTTSPILG